MALINFTGFSSGTVATEANLTSGSISFVTTPLIAGGAYTLRVNPTTTGTAYWGLGVYNSTGIPTTFGLPTIYVGFFFQYATKPASLSEDIVVLQQSGAPKISIRITSAGVLAVYSTSGTTLVATGTTVLNANTWYYISMRFENTAGGPYLLAINNIVELDGAISLTAANFEGVRLGKPNDRNGNSVDYYYGKVQVSGTNLPTMLGKTAVMRPTVNGSTAQWTSGNFSDWNGVKELPSDDDTSYIMNSATVSQLNLVAFGSMASLGIFGKVGALKGWIRTREDTTVTSATHLRIKSGATNTDTATAFNGSTTYADQLKTQNADPNIAGPWTLGAVEAVELGVLEDNAVQVRCTTMAVFVDYVPLPGPGMMGVG